MTRDPKSSKHRARTFIPHHLGLAALAALLWAPACPKDAPPASPPAGGDAPAAGGPSAASAAPASPTPPRGSARRGRIVVLGFDGVDPDLVDRWKDDGSGLPHLARLAATGTYARLGSTTPPQSPVAWATFATGLPPGDHGIFDFIARTPRTYLPSVATVRIRRPEVRGGKLVHGIEGENLRHGPSFWYRAAEAGVEGTILFVPYSFPPDGSKTMRVISGLGTPDLRGTNSSFHYLARSIFPGGKKAGPTSGGLFEAASGEASFSARLAVTSLRTDGQSRAVEIPVQARIEGQTVALTFPAGNGPSVTLRRGIWSDPLSISFEIVPGVRWSGLTRAYPVPDAGDPLALYFSPLGVDPRAPVFPISSPPGFARSLVEGLGEPFKTVGWVHDTSGLSTGALDDAGFLSDLHRTMEQRHQLLLKALDDPKSGRLVVAAFTATDRVAHMFYRALDPKHPLYDPKLAARFGDAIEKTYQAMDRIVGDVMARLGPDDTLLVVSDHGFHSFRRGVNLNRWLIENGYQHLRAGAEAGRDFFRDVDFSRTRAYAVGTGQIWLNLKGREGKGIVDPKDAAALAREIATRLAGLRDGKTPVVSSVHLRADTYTGPAADQAPDLTVSFTEGYRTGWGSVLGGAPVALFEDNTRKWSGDHAASEPKDTEGVLFSNRKIATPHPSIEDVASTVLHLLGVESDLPGQVWLP